MSNRSSRFVHPLQSLTSALAGGSRRLPALAVVLALLVLALLPTTGQAQSDTTPPALESATVLADGVTIELVFNEPIDQSHAPGHLNSPYSVTADGSAVTIGEVNIPAEEGILPVEFRKINLKELSPAITFGQDVIFTYTDPTTGDDFLALQDVAGNEMASFTTGSGGVPAVVNNVPAPPTPVPTTWGLVPSGLGDGDSFRLIFLSSGFRAASSSDIDVYNTFVQNQAAAGHEDIQAHSATFRMLGSTEDVDARDNTATTGTGVPIYWLGGAKVADDYADFYDGGWDEEATGRRQTGASVSIGTDWKIWTGSAHDGTEAMDTGTGTSRALGNSGNHWVMQGSPNGSDSAHGPIQGNTAGRNTNRGVYGLSGVFTVDASLDVETPGAPQNVEATAGTGKVTLTWDAPASEGGGEITHYEYQRKEGSGDYGDWTTAETVEFGTDSHSAILHDATTLDHYDVTAETTYTYRVRAVNAGGGGDASGEDSATTGAAMTVSIEASPQRVMEDEDEGTVTVTVVAEMPATGPNTEKYDLEFEVAASTLPGTASFGTGDFIGFNEVYPVFAPRRLRDGVRELGRREAVHGHDYRRRHRRAGRDLRSSRQARRLLGVVSAALRLRHHPRRHRRRDDHHCGRRPPADDPHPGVRRAAGGDRRGAAAG